MPINQGEEVVLYDVNGTAMAVSNGVAVPAGTTGLLLAGSDGTNARFLLVDTNGRPIVVGAGTAGAPAGGVVTMQGIAGGVAAPVSGTVTANQGTPVATASAWPTKVTDGTNMATVKPAATAPVAGDSSLVITISPNSPPITAANPSVGINAAAAPTSSTQIGATDGTNLLAARMKGASATPVAADPSLVVTISPNSSPITVTPGVPTSTTPNLAFGNIALAAITTAAINKTTYTEQTVNFQGSIASAVAADAAAGTGARTVRIYFVNSTGATAGTEDVTLNGVAFVNLVTTTKCFIEKIEVLTVGSGGANAGIITLKAGLAGAGVTIGTIAVGDNRTFWAHHYVVTGKTSNITGMLAGSTSTNTAGIMIGFLRARPIGVADAVNNQVSDQLLVSGLNNSVFRAYNSQVEIVGPARISMYVTTLNGAAFTYYGSFDAYDS